MKTPLLRRCFVIGPMRDMARLRRLTDAVVKPLLEPAGYVVSTPDHAETGLVTNQILLSLEQADLLIADLTGNNPNVLYELGIYHAFGKASILVREDTGHPADQPPFDVRAYRYLTIDLDQPEQARATLGNLIRDFDLFTKIDRLDFFANPVTDFYGSPIAEIPTAIGLAKNYTQNFLAPVLPGIFTLRVGTDEYDIRVEVETVSDPERPGRVYGPLRPLTPDERDRLRVEIWVPNQLDHAEKSYLRGLMQRPDRPFLNAQVHADRIYSCYARQAADGTITIIDVPTILSSLNQSINSRRRSVQNMNIRADGWEVLQRQEVERFEAKCQAFLETKRTAMDLRRVQIVRWDGA